MLVSGDQIEVTSQEVAFFVYNKIVPSSIGKAKAFVYKRELFPFTT